MDYEASMIEMARFSQITSEDGRARKCERCLQSAEIGRVEGCEKSVTVQSLSSASRGRRGSAVE